MPRVTYEPNVIYKIAGFVYLMDPSGRWWIIDTVENGKHPSVVWMHGVEHNDITHIEFYMRKEHGGHKPRAMYRGRNVRNLKPHLWRFLDPIGQQREDFREKGDKGENYQLYVKISIPWYGKVNGSLI